MTSAELRKKFGSGAFKGDKAEVSAFVAALPVSLNQSGSNGPSAYCLFVHLAGGESIEEAQAACGTDLGLETALQLLKLATSGGDSGFAKLMAEKLEGELSKPVDIGETTIKPVPAKKKPKPKNVPKPPPGGGTTPATTTTPPLVTKKSNTLATVLVVVGFVVVLAGAAWAAWLWLRDPKPA